MRKQKTKSGKVDRPETDEADAAFPADLQIEIGRRLKAHYDSILAAPIPERIAALLDRLGEAEADKDGVE